MLNDLRYGMRMLRKNPGFTAVAVLTLALGIGANTAIFSVVNAVLLRPFPYNDPDRLVLLREGIPRVGENSIPVSAPDVLEFQRQNQVFEQIAAFQNRPLDLSGVNEPERLRGARVSASLFPLLGVQAMLGRTFSTEEDQPGHNVVVLSYGLWQRRFGADPLIIGKTIALDLNPYVVVGVMPRGFQFPQLGMAYASPADLWVPMAFTPDELGQRGDNFAYGVVARLKPGISTEQANANVHSIAQRIRETYPPAVRDELDLTAQVGLLHEEIVGNVRRLLLVLLGAVGFVLLIACANVANLLLVRAASRRREMAIRLALGAGQSRIFRQLLVDGFLLSLLGGGLGWLVANWGIDLLVTLAADNLPRASEVNLDMRVLGFTLLLSLSTSLLFGLAPFFEISRISLSETIKEGSRSLTGGAHHNRLRAVLVVGEVALSLVLLAGSGLLIRSFQRLRQTDLGFSPRQALSMELSLPAVGYRRSEQVKSFYQELLERLGTLPGVQVTGAGTDLPLESGWRELFTAESRDEPPTAMAPQSAHTVVLGDYFRALGIPLKKGRYFTEQDRLGARRTIIINETVARHFWPDEDPIGKRIKLGTPQSNAPWLTIVGVVADVKDRQMNVETRPHTYEPFLQYADPPSRLNIVVRGFGKPGDLASSVRRQVWSLDSTLPVAHLRSMEQVVAESITSQRLNTLVLSIFAVAALVLASVGLYGVTSYSVAQQTQEMGIRIALGAQPIDVLRLVVSQGMRLTLIGVAIGLAAALALTRLMASLLFGVSAADPVTFLSVSLVLASVAVLACYIPARRATKVDPMVALRYE